MRKLEYRHTGSRSRRTRSHAVAQAGSVSLEFIILFPFLIMVLVGIFDFSLMMYDKAALVTAARTAARAGIVVGSTVDVAATAVASANGSLLSGGASRTPTATVTHPNGTTSGMPLIVTISYTYNGLLVGSALSALTGPIVLNATAVMNYE
ncbi:TadE/TadG family type IV pilus assembly protein [Caballeronia ptereochthonis]|uniref:TadE family protein n=1 Tax=Caballeronia ptereochthonis TaxID=1777144 RepID=A0A158E469_9BURK|nr:TadE family protein [Caballeronia ptereochthonis]SAL01628.1 TadE family protein [Caballeronia ptereochthonis]